MASASPEQLKVLSALASADEGSTGADMYSSLREIVDNSIDEKCSRVYMNWIYIEDLCILVIADDGNGVSDPTQLYTVSSSNKRKSLDTKNIGEFQEGLRHVIGYLSPYKVTYVSRGDKGRCSCELMYQMICNDRKDGSLRTKEYKDYHKTTIDTMSDTAGTLLHSVKNTVQKSEKLTSGDKFLLQLCNELETTSSTTRGTIAMYVWDNKSDSPKIDLKDVYTQFCKYNYPYLIQHTENTLNNMYIGREVINNDTAVLPISETCKNPHLYVYMWIKKSSDDSYTLICALTTRTLSDEETKRLPIECNIVGYSLELLSNNLPRVNTVTNPRTYIGGIYPDCMIEHTCTSKNKEKGLISSWNGRVLGDKPIYYEGNSSSKWDPKGKTAGWGAKRTSCARNWLAVLHMYTPTIFRILIAGNLKDRCFPFWQGKNTIKAFVANFILSEVIGMIHRVVAPQNSKHKKGVTTHGDWMSIVKKAIHIVNTRCNVKHSIDTRCSVNKAKPKPIKPSSFFDSKSSIDENPRTYSQQSNMSTSTQTSSKKPLYTLRSVKGSSTTHPGVILTVGSEKTIFKSASGMTTSAPTKIYLEGFLKNMKTSSQVSEFINGLSTHTNPFLPYIVESLHV